MIRAIDVMQVMKQLNNFNGLLEFVASFNSSAIHRLNHTKEVKFLSYLFSIRFSLHLHGVKALYIFKYFI